MENSFLGKEGLRHKKMRTQMTQKTLRKQLMPFIRLATMFPPFFVVNQKKKNGGNLVANIICANSFFSLSIQKTIFNDTLHTYKSGQLQLVATTRMFPTSPHLNNSKTVCPDITAKVLKNHC